MKAPTRRPRRSVHFVPGGNEKFFAKAIDSAADTLVLDLEDSVPSDRKVAAREAVVEWLAGADTEQELMVRINATDTPWARADVDAVVSAGAESLMVPKVSDTGELDDLQRWVDGMAPDRPPTLFPVATETAAAVFALPRLAQHPSVDGVCWGAEDLSAVLGAASARDATGEFLEVFRVVRSWCLLGAAAGSVGAVDAVWTDLSDLDGLRRESSAGAAMGFIGKITIHPAQIEIVNEAFSPSVAAVAAARALIDAFERHRAEGRDAFTFEGSMVDAPHLARAQGVLARAASTGGPHP